jgi:hypothetical protein
MRRVATASKPLAPKRPMYQPAAAVWYIRSRGGVGAGVVVILSFPNPGQLPFVASAASIEFCTNRCDVPSSLAARAPSIDS